MLDLKLLEKKLDEVLKTETSETLTSWLFNRRLKSFIYLLGEGDFINMPNNEILISQSESFIVESEINEYSTEYSSEYNDNDYLSAA